MAKDLQKLLTIDDDDDLRMIGALILETQGGFAVDSFGSGQAALDHLDGLDEGSLPDLILLDVMMPHMDGPDTLQKIRTLPSETKRDIPVIFLTAKCQPDEIVRLVELGAIGVIPKPFDAMTLSQEVRDLWQNHLQKS
ncbi:response regulator [Kiloniella sp. b19]|uniref:response regulator n=1 Tax=Kiloniella sp. GXU_MW_B19 TaxID=3141326 RepID=UPI0031DA9BBC